ncbi:hypothetical protein WAF17_09380 [Bernardetia sp. ABR2-2B]|uniref:hypothetical protein n=1 Tax=Bernardetia sp. ABR2-2B TaxID=3127472 RepID=UPI0030D2D622
MKKIESKVEFKDTHNLIAQKISSHLEGLNKYKKDDQQKILELCQVGKLLGTYFNDFEIKEVTEKPDFVITNGQVSIGVEHELILDNEAKAKEGFYENICEKVEINLQNDDSIPNCLVNLYLKGNLSFKVNDKVNLISDLTEIVKKFILTDTLIENKIVRDAHKMRHSRKNVIPNFGAYMQKTITKDLIFKHIEKKKDKIATYRKNTELKQWLVLIIGGLGASSFEVDESFDMNIETDFDKVFLYEDFRNQLYELK